MNQIITVDGKKLRLVRSYFWESICPSEAKSYFDSHGRYIVVSEPVYHGWYGAAGNQYDEYEPVED